MPARTPMRVSTRIAPRTCKSPVARHGACFPARALAVVVADLVAAQDDEQERGSEAAAPRPERAPDQLRRRLPLAEGEAGAANLPLARTRSRERRAPETCSCVNAGTALASLPRRLRIARRHPPPGGRCGMVARTPAVTTRSARRILASRTVVTAASAAGAAAGGPCS